MRRLGAIRKWAYLLLGLHAGCASSSPVIQHPPTAMTKVRISPYHPVSPLAHPRLISDQSTVSSKAPEVPPILLTSGRVDSVKSEPPQSGITTNELSVDGLVEAVLERNPKLAQMQAAWEAASARYPQVTSLEDPMVTGIIGPASIGSNMVDTAYRVEASQKFPFPGKRGLRGQMVQSEADAAANEVDDMRLQLIETTKDAYYEFYLVHRAVEVNDENLRLMQDFQKTAESRFRAGQSPQQDILQAEVEIGKQRERGLALERMRKVAVARINTLLHVSPDNTLPPAPKKLTFPDTVPSVDHLRAQAVASRPDLQALMNRLRTEVTSLALAYKEYKPDFEVMAAYDAFWQPEEKDLRPMLGVRMNVPVQRKRRQAAVAEASAKIAQRQAELASQIDQVHFQVQEAYERVVESAQAVKLYETTVLPSAADNVKAAQAAYVTGQTPFLSLIEAQRNAVMLRDRYYEIQSDYFRRRATLERVIGAPVGLLEGVGRSF